MDFYLLGIQYNSGINLSTRSFQIISETCLNIIMNYTKSEPEVTISFTYIQPAPVVLAMF